MLVSALFFEIQLNMVVFPMFAIPIIPHLSAIMLMFDGSYYLLIVRKTLLLISKEFSAKIWVLSKNILLLHPRFGIYV